MWPNPVVEVPLCVDTSSQCMMCSISKLSTLTGSVASCPSRALCQHAGVQCCWQSVCASLRGLQAPQLPCQAGCSLDIHLHTVDSVTHSPAPIRFQIGAVQLALDAFSTAAFTDTWKVLFEKMQRAGALSPLP